MNVDAEICGFERKQITKHKNSENDDGEVSKGKRKKLWFEKSFHSAKW